MVSLTTVYDVFLSKVNEDDWSYDFSEEDLQWLLKDWRAFLNQALPYFKFPRCSLEIDEAKQVFVDDNITQEEIQIIATYMKYMWLLRTIDSWENIKTQYEEKDFSQANLLKTFISLKDQVFQEALNLENIYYRSVKKKPFHYHKLAGKGYNRR